MSKLLTVVYSLFGVLLFNASLIYFILLISPMLEAELMNSGTVIPFFQALTINIVLIILFGVQHSVMARPRFKEWWSKIIPTHLERSTYVVISSVFMILLCVVWQPLPDMVWHVEEPFAYWFLVFLFGFGWLFSLYATFLIDHADLLGLQQAFSYWREKPYIPVTFQVVSVYKYIRHPIMLGTICGLWATPSMSMGHLVLAIGFTVYILIGIYFEERDMIKTYGDVYTTYQQNTSMLFPFFKKT